LAFLESNAKPMLESIERSRDLAAQTEAELKMQLKKFEETHPGLFQGDTLKSPGVKVSP
jgi:hypothetical protein